MLHLINELLDLEEIQCLFDTVSHQGTVLERNVKKSPQDMPSIDHLLYVFD
jgi:hypothetical protein